MYKIIALRDSEDSHAEIERRELAWKLIMMTVTHDSGRNPGDFIRRYGKSSRIHELKAEHFNHPRMMGKRNS